MCPPDQPRHAIFSSRLTALVLCALLLSLVVLTSGGLFLLTQASPEALDCSSCDDGDPDDEVAGALLGSYRVADLILPPDRSPRLRFQAASIVPLSPPPKSS